MKLLELYEHDKSRKTTDKMAKALKVAVEALKKVERLNIDYAIDKYGDATKINNYGCIVTIRNAIAKIQQITEAE